MDNNGYPRGVACDRGKRQRLLVQSQYRAPQFVLANGCVPDLGRRPWAKCGPANCGASNQMNGFFAIATAKGTTMTDPDGNASRQIPVR
jgi:hypothetical protein